MYPAKLANFYVCFLKTVSFMESFTEVDKTSPRQRRLSDYFLDTFKNSITHPHIRKSGDSKMGFI